MEFFFLLPGSVPILRYKSLPLRSLPPIDITVVLGTFTAPRSSSAFKTHVAAGPSLLSMCYYKAAKQRKSKSISQQKTPKQNMVLISTSSSPILICFWLQLGDYFPPSVRNELAHRFCASPLIFLCCPLRYCNHQPATTAAEPSPTLCRAHHHKVPHSTYLLNPSQELTFRIANLDPNFGTKCFCTDRTIGIKGMNDEICWKEQFHAWVKNVCCILVEPDLELVLKHQSTRPISTCW